MPLEYRQYIDDLLVNNGLDVSNLWSQEVAEGYGNNMHVSGASEVMDVAFQHPIKLIVNALGVPPEAMM